jgi:hypothetical protein
MYERSASPSVLLDTGSPEGTTQMSRAHKLVLAILAASRSAS